MAVQERGEGDLDRDIDVRAWLLVLGAAGSRRSFEQGGHILGPVEALQHHPLVVDLMKLGLFSLNVDMFARENPGIAIPEDFQVGGEVTLANVPLFLIAMGFLYAIKVAPNSDEGEDEDENVISLDGLRSHIARIEGSMGSIAYDPILTSRVTTLAAELVNSPDFDPDVFEEDLK